MARARTSEGDVSPGVAAAEAGQRRFGLLQTGSAQLFVHLCRVPLWLTIRVGNPQHAAFPDRGRQPCEGDFRSASVVVGHEDCERLVDAVDHPYARLPPVAGPAPFARASQ